MLEWTAALCSILGVWLMAKRRLVAWPVGLLSVTLYGLVFAEAKLYSDTLLQVAFGGFLVYGWLNWRQHAADEGSVRIVPLARGKLLRDLAIGIALTLPIYWLFNAGLGVSLPSLINIWL